MEECLLETQDVLGSNPGWTTMHIDASGGRRIPDKDLQQGSIPWVCTIRGSDWCRGEALALAAVGSIPTPRAMLR